MGISYGTTGEQVFLTRHPDRVRTMTLLSGTLLDVPVFERFPESAQRALDRVFAECERDAACQRAFPPLRTDWDALWSSVNAAPWVVPADQSPTAPRSSSTRTGSHRGCTTCCYVATTHARIPLVVHAVGAAEDRVAALLAVTQAYPAPAPRARATSRCSAFIRCNEAWAHYDPDQLVGIDSFEYKRDLSDAEWWRTCVRSSPKPATPPRRPAHEVQCPYSPSTARRIRRTRPPTWQEPSDLAEQPSLTVPGQGHDIDPVSAPCVIPLVQSFVDRGAVTGLDTTCLSQLPPPTFDLSLPNN